MNNKKNNSIFQYTGDQSNNNRGKIFQRYNVATGKIENYLIPNSKIEAYRNAVFEQDLDAPKKFGTRVSGM